MEPLITNKETGIGRIEIEVRQFKTMYTYKGVEYEGLNWLNDLPHITINLITEERDTLRRHYSQAVKPRSIDSMLVELSDRGVETNRLQIPCAREGCKETEVEEVTAPMRLDEVASEAEYVCGFKDGLCQSCYAQEQREQAEEDAGRARHEAREEYPYDQTR